MNTWKSIGAFFAGLLATVILSIGTDMVMHATGIFPPMGQPMNNSLFTLATLYRTIYSIFGAYLTASLAPAHPMKHALILGAVGTVLALIGLLATWNKGPEFGPKWYAIALVILAIPQCWLGGKLRILQLHTPVPAKP
ncbi:MAG TPA: hypothetical protein VK525_11110 [Candidatus Saccharimonadales bacterium]|nr:hypothetical protein [Candidatus Saccharimonadales bacterium]